MHFFPGFLLLLLAAHCAVAQTGLRAGVLVGGHLSQLGGYDAGDDTEERFGLGYGAGLTASYGLTPSLSVRLDVRPRATPAARVGQFPR